MDTFIKILEKFSTRPLFYIFGGLSTCQFFQKKTALQEPSSSNISTLFASMVIILLAFWMFESLISKFNSSLQSNDPGDLGPVIGTASLAVYLVFVLHYLGYSLNPINFIISGWVRVHILNNFYYYFSLEMFKLSRFR